MFCYTLQQDKQQYGFVSNKMVNRLSADFIPIKSFDLEIITKPFQTVSCSCLVSF